MKSKSNPTGWRHVAVQQRNVSDNYRPISKHETRNNDKTPHHRRTNVTANRKDWRNGRVYVIGNCR